MTPARKRLLDYWEEHGDPDEEFSPPLFGEPEGDPLDAAVIGLGELPPGEGGARRLVWVYDGRAIRRSLIAEGGKEDEVDDHLSYNILGSIQRDGPMVVFPLCDCEDEAHDCP